MIRSFVRRGFVVVGRSKTLLSGAVASVGLAAMSAGAFAQTATPITDAAGLGTAFDTAVNPYINATAAKVLVFFGLALGIGLLMRWTRRATR
jgi:cell division protein FtsX